MQRVPSSVDRSVSDMRCMGRNNLFLGLSAIQKIAVAVAESHFQTQYRSSASSSGALQSWTAMMRHHGVDAISSAFQVVQLDY